MEMRRFFISIQIFNDFNDKILNFNSQRFNCRRKSMGFHLGSEQKQGEMRKRMVFW